MPRLSAVGISGLQAGEDVKVSPLMTTQSILYVVATPIGNLADITLRALDILRSVDLIAAEDTRHAAGLLRHHNIQTPMLSYHHHNEQQKTIQLKQIMSQGASIALISDAGTPGISDPGEVLIRMAWAEGWRVIPIPGACAITTLISASPLAGHPFYFEGFLPSKEQARAKRLAELGDQPYTLIFYEAPHRLLNTVKALITQFGSNRFLCLGKELTKIFETIRWAPLEEQLAWVQLHPNHQKGEFILALDKAEIPQKRHNTELVLTTLMEKLSLKDAVQIAHIWTECPKNELYEQALLLAQKSNTNL